MRHEHRTIIPEMVRQESTSLRKFSRNHQEPRMTKILSSSFVHKERAPRSIGSLASVSTLLHPALLAHRNPRRVVIITTAIPSEACDGDAALYIQEALKHNAIEKIYVILVGVDNRKGFKGCLSMENRRVGSYWISLDDFELGAVHKILRVAMKAQGDNADMGEVVEGYDIDGIEKSPISILFVDASITSRLSPDVVVSWYNKLLPPKGKSHHSHPMMIVELVGPDSSSFTARYRYALAERLASDPEKSVTAKMTDFEAVLSTGSGDVRNYVTVFQALSTEAYWHRNEAEWSLTMREKLQADSRGGEHIFEYLDSAMMSLFEYPSKHSEVEYCRRNPTYDACKIGGSGFDPQKPNIKLDQLTVRKSLQGENAGRGVFTLVDIRKQSYIGAENRDFVLCRWKCNKIILDFADETDQEVEKISYVNRHKSLYSYFHGYGYADNTWVSVE